MKNIVSALKYLFKNFLIIGLFALPAAVFFALKYDSTNFYNYVFNLGNEESMSLIKIYSHFSILPSFSILMIAFWAVLLLCTFCLAFSYIEKHMKYGIKNFAKAFKSLNYTLPAVIPALITVIAVEELFSFTFSLFIKFISLSQSSLVGIILPCLYALMLMFLFLIYSLLSLWIPIKTVTGYSNKDAIRYSIRLTQGSQFKIMIGLVFPLIVTAPVMVLLKHFSQITLLNTAVYVLCYVFIFGYIPSFLMAAYFNLSGMERKDIKKKIFRH